MADPPLSVPGSGASSVTAEVLHGAMKKYAIAAVFVLAVLGLGCREQSGLPSRGFVEQLREKAQQLAESELERLNAIEQQYKNEIEFHHHHSLGTQAFTKTYREFIHAEVVDIYRSESYLFPITYEITFTYEHYTTPFRHVNQDKGAAMALSEKDTEYTLYNTAQLTRRYRCDATGEYDGSLPPMPPVTRFFEPTPPEIEAPTANPLPPPRTATKNLGHGKAVTRP
ncbi:MAG: hypothetical protein JXR94_18335 [Candidatus Hydrogenedentes bacterium]|nr:hypothetical protein [Candidatus Hydrogenedentota bacterium]